MTTETLVEFAFEQIEMKAILDTYIAHRDRLFADHPGEVIRGDLYQEFARLNTAHASAMEALLRTDPEYADADEYELHVAGTVLAAISRVAVLPGIVAEKTGAWVWVSGETTRQWKEQIKAAGYFWADHKKQWVFKGKPSHSRKAMDMDYIRARYGSRVIGSND